MKKMVTMMNGLRKNREVQAALRWVLGLVFLVAGTAKLLSGHQEMLAAGFKFIPLALAPVLETGLPWVEIGLGLLLLSGYLRRAALITAFSLALIFAGTNLYSLVTGSGTDCGCFGGLLALNHSQSLAVDLMMLAATLPLLLVRAAGAPVKFRLAQLRAAALAGLLLVNTAPAVVQAAEGNSPLSHPVMPMTDEILKEWEEDYNNAPQIGRNSDSLEALDSETYASSYSLLDNLTYDPDERDQGSAGNCWVWAGTGIMEMSLYTDMSVSDRLSIQYLDSNYSSGSGTGWAGCGGNLAYFASFYNSKMIAVPWSNENADYQDGSQVCKDYASAVKASSIDTTPNYTLSGGITASTISTTSVSDAAAISTIKSVLTQGQAVYFGFTLPYSSTYDDWTSFQDDFWGNDAESVVWNPSIKSGATLSDYAGHAVLCVGYNDSADDPYWIMLNSWGTTTGRPDGYFLVSQDLDYGATFKTSGGSGYYFRWQTLSNIYGAVAPSVTTTAATSVTGTSATLNCNVTSLGSASSATLSFEWGTVSGSYSQETDSQIINSKGTYYDNISGLASGTMYYFRPKVVGSSTVYGSELTFTTEGTPVTAPAVTTGSAGSLGQTSATLNGTLTSLGSAGTVSASFEYWADGSSTVNTTEELDLSSAPYEFSMGVTGLTAETLYYYRAKAVGDATAYGGEANFTTLAQPVAPQVTTAAATNITSIAATLNGVLTGTGSTTPVRVYFEYGDEGYGQSVEAGSWSTGNSSFTAEITGLQPGQSYHYRAVAVGSETVYGADASLTADSAPMVSLGEAGDITGTTAVIHGALISPGSTGSAEVGFEYGTTESYGSTVSAGSLSAGADFSATLSGLRPNTIYYYRAYATGSSTVYAGGGSLTTPVLPLGVTTSAASGLSTTSATLNGTLTGLGTAESAAVYFDYGTAAGVYDLTAAGTPAALTDLGSFTAVLSGLTSGKTYYFRARAVAGEDTVTGAELSLTAKKKSSGGGGGGGGGSSSTTISVSGFTSSAGFKVNSSGQTLIKQTLTLEDGTAVIVIPKGTLPTTAKGAVLGSLTAAADAAPPEAPDGKAIVAAYIFGPDGAKFNPVLTLTLKYGGLTLPEGATEDGLSLAYWDGTQWTEVDSQQDQTAHTLTASLSHFSRYALLAAVPLPAELAVSDLQVAPSSVEPGETIAVSAQVANAGGSAGTWTVVLKVDDSETGREEISLEAGAGERVSFNVKAGEAGSYSVEVNGVRGQFQVKEPAVQTAASPTTAAVISTPAAASPSVTPAGAVPSAPAASATTSPAAGKTDSGTSLTVCYLIGAIIVIALVVALVLILRRKRA